MAAKSRDTAGSGRKRVGRPRELSPNITGTQFWLADKQLFDQEVTRRHTTPAQLLRDIAHEWAAKLRLSGQASESVETTIRRTHEKIVSEQVTPVRDTVSLILTELRKITTAAVSPDGNISGTPAATSPSPTQPAVFNQEVLAHLAQLQAEIEEARLQNQRLLALCFAHYMLSTQTFATTWAALDFIQRFLVEPVLKTEQETDPYNTSVTQREDSRKEGLQMVNAMNEVFRFPEPYQMILIAPPEDA